MANKSEIKNRINTALAVRDKKQKELAAYLGVKDNVVSYFVSGARVPNTEQIIKISKFLNVSTDYLLGQSDNLTTDPTVKAACDYTGLSENAVSLLHAMAENKEIDLEYHWERGLERPYYREIDILSILIEALNYNPDMLDALMEFFNTDFRTSDVEEIQDTISAKYPELLFKIFMGGTILKGAAYKKYVQTNVERCFSNFMFGIGTIYNPDNIVVAIGKPLSLSDMLQGAKSVEEKANEDTALKRAALDRMYSSLELAQKHIEEENHADDSEAR